MTYRIGIKEFDSRFSFAIASNPNLRESIYGSISEAFALSGRGLKP